MITPPPDIQEYAEVCEAIAKGNVSRCLEYLSRGDDPRRVPAGRAPLFFVASRSGQVEIMRLLMDRSAADLNYVTGEYHYTPLMIAATNGHAGAVRFLLEHGADTSVMSVHCLDAIQLAEKNRRGAVLEVFREFGYSPSLFAYVLRGDVPGLVKAIEEGADFRRPDGAGRTVLPELVRHGYFDLAFRLIAQGTDINGRGLDGETALLTAAEKGDVELARRLLDAGADIEYPGPGNLTPLMVAAEEGHVAVMELLLGRSADINAADETNSTALHRAVGGNQIEAVRLLLKRGIDTRIGRAEPAGPEGQELQTAEEWAWEWGHAEIAGLIARNRKRL